MAARRLKLIPFLREATLQRDGAKALFFPVLKLRSYLPEYLQPFCNTVMHMHYSREAWGKQTTGYPHRALLWVSCTRAVCCKGLFPLDAVRTASSENTAKNLQLANMAILITSTWRQELVRKLQLDAFACMQLKRIQAVRNFGFI